MSHPHRKSSRIVFLLCATLLSIIAVPGLTNAQQKTESSLSNTRAQPSDLPASNETVFLNVTVQGKDGRYLLGLNKKQFTLYDDKKPQEITFFDDRDEAMSIAIVLDLSGSMTDDHDKKRLDFIKEAISRFVYLSHPANEYSLIVFNSTPQVLLESARGGQNVEAALDKFPKFGKGNGFNTALYDACYLGIDKVQHGAYPKRALLVISDGQDNNSQHSFDDVRRLLKREGVTLYAAAVFAGNDVGSTLPIAGQSILDELSAVSGGEVLSIRNSDKLENLLAFFAVELRSQYRIGFSPAKFTGGEKWHRLKVDVALPADSANEIKRVIVRTRQGYYANASQH
jgi:Ca-activated chloride channel family protein